MSDEVLQVPFHKELDALFGQHTAAGHSRALVYGVTDQDGLSHAAGFGTVDEHGGVPDADVVFPIASMTKSFIACAVLIARDQGQLSLHDPITRYVPEFVLADDRQDVPTIEMLLGMCGGLTEDNSWVDPFINTPTEDLLAQVSEGVRLSHLPGAVFEYSNLGFTIAALALSRAVGRPLAEFVTEELLRPLGLTSTFCDTAVPDHLPRAVGYSLDTEGNWVAYPPQTSDAFLGAGGLVSTVRDLARWITWLGSAFRPERAEDDTPVLSRLSRRDLQRVRVFMPPSLTLAGFGQVRLNSSGYALGLAVTTDLHRGTVISHGGGLPGFWLYMAWHPESGHGAVVLTNGNRGNPGGLCVEALGRVLNRNQAHATTATLWPETIALRAQADSLIRHWDDSLAARIFAENIDFDRPLPQRRAELARLVAEVGPLLDSRPSSAVSASTAADITWSIPGERGELLCMIHLTPVEPARIQEFVVKAVPAGRSRSASPTDISLQRRFGDVHLTPAANVRLRFPEADREE
ncbi:serine hydrolase domain-containing protein [Lentzea flaviverrucosa]|uniref:CubicO group peptidase, beta-lactamase class C family n=1 Tax=Lentzea flaviverrucosa TaxID=200379 RepID=A0A1H9C1W1_9PSEU|nr:serine hydrolase domain-containing protein [Lentzea flaviverrucosa]RDI24431.1 CubicO group peptidase (beta-lactamase class C family) [Lentzea flaviverrucosa]SEP95265.1 CubicO group peptidase, beta-lactamase class C family [Lentzea flaviverrucosa]